MNDLELKLIQLHFYRDWPVEGNVTSGPRSGQQWQLCGEFQMSISLRALEWPPQQMMPSPFMEYFRWVATFHQLQRETNQEK
ncbi:hypothetical protein AVEN_182840-1 [Araneus ventricosus]|uniref:Uncharacterized protein n=1 Tax=Araneus ventricosus TaxID=182803 RepID=A0A4Y2M232_ARAVE|nr:hypothetical protein AVEN_182840-1 [Araneus ventricosus]